VIARLLIASILPALLALPGLASDSKTAFDFEDYKAKAIVRLTQLSASHDNVWNMGKAERWDADQENGILRWTFGDGTMVEAKYQVVGTYNPETETFHWSWDDRTVPKRLTIDASNVKSLGESHKIAALTTAKLTFAEEEAWELAALTVKLNDRKGLYRGKRGPIAVFMSFDDVKILKPQKTAR
jgi:hypothetical protein